MWGAYEIPLPRFIAHRVGRRGHDTEPTVLGDFLTGAFATLLATPCTAPFLGTAIGFALAGSSLDILAIFTMLGIGLAAPYILLAVMPGLFKYLPRPGKWMLHLRRVMAFALVTTAIWLGATLHTITTQPTLDAGWRKFDEALVAPAVAEGRVVFVDITADWCITCKANKRLVIDTPDVQAALNQPHIIKLQGDWTQQDETIAAYLRSFGKFGIPFNVVYGPAAPQGVVLPELLSKRAVTDALTMATGE
jgi:suppressor for copper-sensitivity B